MQRYWLLHNLQVVEEIIYTNLIDMADSQVKNFYPIDYDAESNQYVCVSLNQALFYKQARIANMAKNLKYEGLKPEAFDQFRSKLQAYGIDLRENSGSFSEKGVSGKYNYNPETEELDLNDLSIGFPASMMLNLDTLASRMTETVVQHGGRPKQDMV